ncbi:MAG: alpha/beta fold hydrolase [Anaerolineales bacterium]|jgi:pimeloyl-ACP methyl ester carboxylesterase
MPIAANLYYAEQRSDTGRFPLVLIHGSGGTHLHWPPEVRRIPGQPVYALDLPGHGKSEGLGQQAVSEYAEAVIAWSDAVGFEQAVFTGHSMGGAICQYLALHFAERVAGLGLIGTGARLRVLPEILENSASSLTFPRAVDLIMQKAYAPQTDPRLVELARARMLEVRPTVLHSDYLACNQFDLMAEIKNIQAPTLIMTGLEDQLTPPRYAQYLANKIPKSTLILVPEAGHMLALEKPHEVASELLNFLVRLN